MGTGLQPVAAPPPLPPPQNLVDELGIEPRLPACKAGVLPLSLHAHISKQGVSVPPGDAVYAISSADLGSCKAPPPHNLVQGEGIEPSISRLSADCSTAELSLDWQERQDSNPQLMDLESIAIPFHHAPTQTL